MLLTCTGGGIWSPHSSSPTSPSIGSNNVVSSVTGVGSSHHEGGSGGCTDLSIGWIREAIAVNNYMLIIIIISINLLYFN